MAGPAGDTAGCGSTTYCVTAGVAARPERAGFAASLGLRQSEGPVSGVQVKTVLRGSAAERAGVAFAMELRGGDALQRMPPTDRPGVMLLNPPYGERIAAAGVAGQSAQVRAAGRGG